MLIGRSIHYLLVEYYWLRGYPWNLVQPVTHFAAKLVDSSSYIKLEMHFRIVTFNSLAWLGQSLPLNIPRVDLCMGWLRWWNQAFTMKIDIF